MVFCRLRPGRTRAVRKYLGLLTPSPGLFRRGTCGALWFTLPCSPERAFMYLAGGAHEPPDGGGSMDRPTPTAQRAEGAAVARTAAELAALSRMTGSELAEKYLVLFGQSARSRDKDFLRKRLAWRIQELAEGGLSGRALARIDELGAHPVATWLRPVRPGTPPSTRRPLESTVRDPRIPPAGTVLRRVHGTTEHSVTVRDDGFEYRGERYRSLSKIARVITGTPWNGYLFFFGRAKGMKSSPGADGR